MPRRRPALLTEARRASNRQHAHNRNPDRWTSSTEKATEHQVVTLLAGLIEALQPDAVLETGTWTGDAALAMAQTLAPMRHNPHLWTLEKDEGVAEAARVRLEGLPVTVVTIDATQWTPPVLFDFAFFDTDGKSRLAQQAERYLQWMRPHAVFAVHDTGTQWPTQKHLDDMATRGLIRCVRLPTPRGVTLCEVL